MLTHRFKNNWGIKSMLILLLFDIKIEKLIKTSSINNLIFVMRV